MEILNSAFQHDLDSKVPIRLNLGAGDSPVPGYYSVDLHLCSSTDILADLSYPLDKIPDNSVSEIYSRHTLEHVENINLLMAEIFRIAKIGARIEIIVPHFSNVFGYSDPTHLRLFGIYSMYYFCDTIHQPRRKVPCHYTSGRFQVVSSKIEFYRVGWIDAICSLPLSILTNTSLTSQEFYERRISSLFHAWQVRFILTPDEARKKSALQ